MSLYLIVGAFLLFGTVYELSCKKTPRYLYFISFAVLTLMLCLRYGQGTDYFAYQYIFEHTPETLDPVALNNSGDTHSELGWKFLCALFRILGLDYYVFVAVIGFVSLMFLNRFIQNYCPLKVTALLIAYPTLYLTYISSGMRQGLVICLFLGLLLKLYIDKKFFKFTVGLVVCLLLHTASWALFLLLFSFIKRVVYKYDILLLLAFGAVGLMLAVMSVDISLFGRTARFGLSGISYIALGERILTFCLVKICFDKYKKVSGEDTKALDDIYYIYLVGMMLYCLLFGSPLLASRTCCLFKIVEIALLTVIISKPKAVLPEVSVLAWYIVILSVVMLIKNIDSYIVQGNYYSSVNVFNYPYHNVFTKDISRYNYYYELLD